ncbi:MAG: UPF0280 family protein [Dehalococcoidia bacterium]|nr:UPF0280 family protein [Dehalococcoidia bacterium]
MLYRLGIKDTDLVSFNVVVEQTNLYIRAERNLKNKALQSVTKHRRSLERYIEHHPLFLTTLEPYPAEQNAPAIVKEMAMASKIADIGPMSAVAGAIAEAVGKDLLPFSPEIIVENGGDIFLKTSKKRVVGIYAGESPFTSKIALEIKPQETPLGICTSSATIGHSLSLGYADAVVALSPSTPLADAIATTIGNIVKDIDAIPQAIEKAKDIPGLYGIIIIKGEQLGVWGKMKIVPQATTRSHRSPL